VILRAGVEVVAETLDAALKQRLRAVLAREPVTEAELRKLVEQGRACTLILSGQLARGEQTLAQLASDPASSLAAIAAAVRRVNELRPELEELQMLLRDLDERARTLRAAWLAPS
jgi:replication-associated recombination protein RarA